MPDLLDKRELTERFGEAYRLHQAPVMREVERAVCGCDYGGTSWTTREEADRVAEILDLRSGQMLFELGGGSGWPGLYLARTTGCALTLVDMPVEGIRIAARRASAERLDGACSFAAADGAALPFADGVFDAVTHSDVLCCLEQKADVLEGARRVVRSGGRMAFSVISIRAGVSPREHARAVEAGPPFVETAMPYASLLERAGWRVADRIDLTAAFGRTRRRLVHEQEARTDALGALVGTAELAERIQHNRNAVDAIEAGLLRRELFVAEAG